VIFRILLWKKGYKKCISYCKLQTDSKINSEINLWIAQSKVFGFVIIVIVCFHAILGENLQLISKAIRKTYPVCPVLTYQDNCIKRTVPYLVCPSNIMIMHGKPAVCTEKPWSYLLSTVPISYAGLPPFWGAVYCFCRGEPVHTQ
jgi:hypothetical protein